MHKNRFEFFRNILLPALFGIYPVLFLYSNNVSIVEASSIEIPLLLMVALAIFLFAVFFVFTRDFVNASITSSFILVLFYLYSNIYTRLVKIDLVQVEDYTLIPSLILLAVYGSFFLSKLPKPATRQFQNILLLVAGVLVIYNIVIAVPSEIKKAQPRVAAKSAIQSPQAGSANLSDIYFLVFDEYAGFDALHEYWKYDGYKEFISFLEQKGFFVAEHSHSRTTETLVEIASRLNLREYKGEQHDDIGLCKEIANNYVMQLLKKYGYTTVVFDGPSLPFPAKPPITADYNMKFEDSYVPMSRGIVIDEFGTLFLDQTMFRVFSSLYSARDLATDPTRKMIFYSLAKVLDLGVVPTPKFVYMHVLLPHSPMMFDENGGPIDYESRADFTLYLGQHKYATKRAEYIIDQLLKNADPKRPPIIILQSDHGFRNLVGEADKAVLLPNYDDRFKTSILNAVYLPGYDYSQLTNDLDPMLPFVIVLNHYFNAGVSIERLPPK